MTPGDTGETTSPSSESDEPSQGLGAAAPLAAWAFAFLVLRLFAASGYDWDTAFRVSTTLRIEDGLRILFGSFMAGRLFVAPLLVFVVPLLVGSYVWSPEGRHPTVLLSAALALVTLMSLTVSFTTWWLPVATAAMLGAFWLVHRLPSEDRLPRALSAVLERAGWLVGVATLLIALVTQTPWVPLERIETRDGTINAYVLSVDSGYLNVLTEDHEFAILLTRNVRSRD